MQYIGILQCAHGPVEYTLRKRRGQKQMTLRVGHGGVVTLTVPWWVSRGVAIRYLESKRQWVADAFKSLPTGTVQCAEGRDAHYRTHKEAARVIVHQKLEALNAHYGFSWGRVAIRRNTTSWGSCSSKRNLNFDYRILFLPQHLQEYLIVHELCHLQEMNHSSRFWALVARVVPEYARCRKELRSVRAR